LTDFSVFLQVDDEELTVFTVPLHDPVFGLTFPDDTIQKFHRNLSDFQFVVATQRRGQPARDLEKISS